MLLRRDSRISRFNNGSSCIDSSYVWNNGNIRS